MGEVLMPRRSYTRECAVCQVTFRPWTSTGKYCSAKCTGIGTTASRKGKPGKFGNGNPLPPRLVVCEVCKQKFEASKKYRKRCCSKPCADALRTRNRRETMGSPPVWRLSSKGEAACRNCGKPAVHLHHIVPRSKSKLAARDVERNGLPLCHECHWGWHSRAIVIWRNVLRAEEIAFATEVAGPVWMDAHYPITLSPERHLALAHCSCDSCTAIKDRQAQAVMYYGGAVEALNAMTGDRYVPERKDTT